MDDTSAHAAAIGSRVRALRIERGLSMRDLAARAGVSQPFVSKLERGHQLPSVTTVYALAAALGATPGALLAPADADPSGRDVHLPLTDGGSTSSVRVVGAPGGMTQVYLFDLLAGEGDGGFRQHAGDELLVVLDGVAVSSEAGRPDIEVAAGGSRSVDTTVPHGLRASPAGPMRALLVCTESRSG